MRGLLYKDLCVLWKSMKLFLLMVVIFCLLPSSGVFNTGMFFAVYTGLLPVTLLSYDERSHWDRLALMLPVTRRDVVRSKYLVGAALSLLAVALYGAGRLLFDRMSPGAALGTGALAVSAALLLQALLYPFLFRLGVEKGRVTIVLISVILVAVVMGFFSVESASPDIHSLAATGAAPLLFAVAVIAELISVRVAERLYAAREV